MREKAEQSGYDSFHSHEILEMLLYATNPRRDTNPIAHNLINTFGSFSAVFDASYDDLLKVDGVGEATATLLKLIPVTAAKYVDDKFKQDGTIINSHENAFKYLYSKYIDKTEELPSALFLNNKGKLIAWAPIGGGSVNSAEIKSRRLVELCLKHNATQIILCHNHPSGIAIPSNSDYVTTKHMIDALKIINVRVLDHIVIAGKDYVSMAESKDFAFLFK